MSCNRMGMGDLLCWRERSYCTMAACVGSSSRLNRSACCLTLVLFAEERVSWQRRSSSISARDVATRRSPWRICSLRTFVGDAWYDSYDSLSTRAEREDVEVDRDVATGLRWHSATQSLLVAPRPVRVQELARCAARSHAVWVPGQDPAGAERQVRRLDLEGWHVHWA